MSESLATGAALTPETFDDFIARLRHHCTGQGVADHCTADALFVVQARRIVTGIDPDYTEQRVAIVEDCMYFSPLDFFKAEGQIDDAHYLPVDDQWEAIRCADGVTVTGFHETWEYVNCHFTKEAAEAFIKRKSHDYPHGLRLFVDSQIYAWEFNAIKNALISGELILRKGA